MKKILLTIAMILGITLSANALGYEEARQRAWFLTDKMAYELNLSQEQYDAVYEINLDYFLRMGNRNDIGGVYWNYRLSDLEYVLYDWQFSMFRNIAYFYRPISWQANAWYFPVYSHYTTGYYYFSRPSIYVSYHGYSGQRMHASPYANRRFATNTGMRDRFYNNNSRGNHSPNNGTIYRNNAGRNDNVYNRGNNMSGNNRSNNNAGRNDNNRANQQQPRTNVQNGRSQGYQQPGMQQNNTRVGRESSTRITVNQDRNNTRQPGMQQNNNRANQSPNSRVATGSNNMPQGRATTNNNSGNNNGRVSRGNNR